MDETPPAAATEAKSWFERRPIPVFIIAAFCVLQFLGIVLFIANNWAEVTEPMLRGLETPGAFLWKLLYPFLLLAAGLAFLALRRVALALFGVYLGWGIGKIIVQTIDFPGYVSLALIFGVLVYGLRLAKQGVLR